MRVLRAATVFFGVCGAGCAFPDYVFPGHAADTSAPFDASGDSAIVDSATGDAALDVPGVDAGDAETGPSPTACATVVSSPACATIEEMIAPDLQVLDGKGDEMCAITPRTFSVDEGQHRAPTTPTGAPQQVSVRVGVSARGVHFFVQVLDDPWIVAADDPVTGDAVEIFVRGVHDPITGKLSSDGGRHFVLVPPDAGKAGDGREVAADGTYAALSAAYFGIRGVSSGYEAEMRLPWTELGGQPAPGDAIAFDVGIDVSDDATLPRRVQSFLYYQSPTSATTCTKTPTADPYCDDRTWCEAFAYHAP